MINGGMNNGRDIPRIKARHPTLSKRSQPAAAVQLVPRVYAILSWMKENLGRIAVDETRFAPKTPTVVIFSPHASPVKALEIIKVLYPGTKELNTITITEK